MAPDTVLPELDLESFLETYGEDAQRLWDFMLRRTDWSNSESHVPVDLIVVLGSHDDRPAERAAELFFELAAQSWQRGRLPRIITTGWASPAAISLWGKTEAAHLADVLVAAGVPRKLIHVEPYADNLGTNASLVLRHIDHMRWNPRHIVVVSKPYIALRAWATFRRHWPDASRLLSMDSPRVTMREWLKGLHERVSIERDVATMVGDVIRTIWDRKPDGTRKHFLFEQTASPDVWGAHERLDAEKFQRPVRDGKSTTALDKPEHRERPAARVVPVIHHAASRLRLQPTTTTGPAPQDGRRSA